MTSQTLVLRAYRRQCAFTQKELAKLLGCSTEHVSRIERLRTNPGLKVALASEIVFGVHTRELFPRMFSDLEDEVVRKLYHFSERLNPEASLKAAKKRHCVDFALNRAAKSVTETTV